MFLIKSKITSKFKIILYRSDLTIINDLIYYIYFD